MSNIIRVQPAGLEIQTKYGVLRYEVSKDLTQEQKAILAAYTAPKIATIPDMELDTTVLRQINQALLLLGHSKTLQDDNDQRILAEAICKLIRDKYSFLTLQDLALVFEMATRGDFKNSPEDVVMVSLEKVSHWLKCYHRQKRAEVISTLKPAEPQKQKPEDYNPETDFESLLQKVKGGKPVTDAEWICQTAQHYDRLNKSNCFNISTPQRQAIYQEERERLKEEGKNRMLHINTETRFLFRAFADGQTGDNQYEKEVKTNCKIRVFREYVQQLATRNKAA